MGLGKMVKGVGKAAKGAAKGVGRAAKGAGRQLEKPLAAATDIMAVVGGPAGLEAKLVKEAVKIGLKNASHPEKIVQGAAKGLAKFVKDPGCAVWQANPTWWQVVAA